MYKKYASLLVLVNLLFCIAFLCEESAMMINNLGEYYEDEQPVVCMNLSEVAPMTKEVMRVNHEITGNRPVFTIRSLELRDETILDENSKMILCKIVEAEAGCEDRMGKILVANVVLNRVESTGFPDTVEEVVYQQNDGVAQFSPIANGSFEQAVPDEDTVEAVEAALAGEDYSQGALYFVAREYADEGNLLWFDRALEKVVSHGGHEFYR